ncbi:MAG: cupin domain-containing protein [Candidatus Bathyarchaeia archaeon]
MQIRNFRSVKPVIMEGHGPTTLYQNIFGVMYKTDVPMKAFTSFWKMTIKPGGTNKPHTHNDQEQIYMVVRGASTVMVGEERQTAKAGDVIFLPPNVPHAVFNETKKPCVIVAVGAKLPA